MIYVLSDSSNSEFGWPWVTFKDIQPLQAFPDVICSYNCAAVNKISTDIVHCTVPLLQLSLFCCAMSVTTTDSQQCHTHLEANTFTIIMFQFLSPSQKCAYILCQLAGTSWRSCNDHHHVWVTATCADLAKWTVPRNAQTACITWGVKNFIQSFISLQGSDGRFTVHQYKFYKQVTEKGKMEKRWERDIGKKGT